MDLDTAQLRAFVAVVDTGTFTDAAIELGITQASVSRRVRGLESAVGTTLLRRTTRSVELSELGERVLVHARNILGEVASVSGLADAGRQTVRVGYAWSALGRHTVPAQRAWTSAHPGSRMHFVQSNTPTGGLAEGAAPLAVLRRPVVDARFESVAVGHEARFLAVAADDPLARRRTVRLADLEDRVIGVDVRTGTTTPSLWADHAERIQVQDTATLDEWLTLIASGEVIGITAESTTEQHPRRGVSYRRIVGIDPIPVSLAWWRNDRPPQSEAITALFRRLYRGGTGGA